MRKLNSDSIIVFVKKSDLKRVPYANQASQFQRICRVYQCLAEPIFICLYSLANIKIKYIYKYTPELCIHIHI